MHPAGDRDRTPNQQASRGLIGRQTSNLHRQQGQQRHQPDPDGVTPMQHSGNTGISSRHLQKRLRNQKVCMQIHSIQGPKQSRSITLSTAVLVVRADCQLISDTLIPTLTIYATGVHGCGPDASVQQSRSLLGRESGVSPVEAGQNRDRWSGERHTGIVQNQSIPLYV